MGRKETAELVSRWEEEYDRTRDRLAHAWRTAAQAPDSLQRINELYSAALAFKTATAQAVEAIKHWCEETATDIRNKSHPGPQLCLHGKPADVCPICPQVDPLTYDNAPRKL